MTEVLFFTSFFCSNIFSNLDAILFSFEIDGSNNVNLFGSSLGFSSNIFTNFLFPDSSFFTSSFLFSFTSSFFLLSFESKISNNDIFFFTGGLLASNIFWFLFSLIIFCFTSFTSFTSFFSSSSKKKFGTFFFSSFFSGLGTSIPSNKDVGAFIWLLLLITTFVLLFTIFLLTLFWLFWFVFVSLSSNKNIFAFLFSFFCWFSIWFWIITFGSTFDFSSSSSNILGIFTSGFGIIIFGSCWTFENWFIGFGIIIFGSFLTIGWLLNILFIFWLFTFWLITFWLFIFWFIFLFWILTLKSSSSSSSRKNFFFLILFLFSFELLLIRLLLLFWNILVFALLFWNKLFTLLFWNKLFVLLLLDSLLNKSFIFLLTLLFIFVEYEEVIWFNLSCKFWLFSSILSLFKGFFFENKSSSSSSSSPNIKFIFDFAFSNLRLFSNSLWVIGFTFWLLLNWLFWFKLLLLIISLFKLLFIFILLFIFTFTFISCSLLSKSFWGIFSSFIIGFIIVGGLWLDLYNFSNFFFLFWKSFKLSSSSSSSSTLFSIVSPFFSSIWGCIWGLFILFCFINNNGFGTISILWFNGIFSFFS